MKINNLKVKESFKNIAITTTLVVSIETSLVLSKGYVNYKNYNDSKNYNFGYATSDYAPVITNIVNNGNEYQVELLYPDGTKDYTSASIITVTNKDGSSHDFFEMSVPIKTKSGSTYYINDYVNAEKYYNLDEKIVKKTK